MVNISTHQCHEDTQHDLNTSKNICKKEESGDKNTGHRNSQISVQFAVYHLKPKNVLFINKVKKTDHCGLGVSSVACQAAAPDSNPGAGTFIWIAVGECLVSQKSCFEGIDSK